MIIVTVARKPISEKTIAGSVLLYGTGALDIEDSRIRTGDNLNGGAYSGTKREKGGEWQSEDRSGGKGSGFRPGAGDFVPPAGRWPPNLILGTIAVEDLDSQSGISKSTGGRVGNASGAFSNQGPTGFTTAHMKADPGFGDVGGASRFFFQVHEDNTDE